MAKPKSHTEALNERARSEICEILSGVMNLYAYLAEAKNVARFDDKGLAILAEGKRRGAAFLEAFKRGRHATLEDYELVRMLKDMMVVLNARNVPVALARKQGALKGSRAMHARAVAKNEKIRERWSQLSLAEAAGSLSPRQARQQLLEEFNRKAILRAGIPFRR